MTDEHAPLPWKLDPDTEGESILDQGGKLAADCAVFDLNDPRRNSPAFNQANAAFIVRAVNSHDALVKALSAACGYMKNAHIDLSTGAKKATAMATLDGGIKIVEAALKFAEVK